MAEGLEVLVVLALFVVGGVLLVVGRRQDARHRASSPATRPRSTATAAALVPVLVLAGAIVATVEAPAAARLGAVVLGLTGIASAAAGSFFITRYAKRTLRNRSGQPWTSDRVANLVLYILAAGLIVTALNLSGGS